MESINTGVEFYSNVKASEVEWVENVGDVLFQALLFDDVKFQTGNIIGELLTIYVLGREIY